MTFFRGLFVVCPLAGLLAQTPPQTQRPATQAPPAAPAAPPNGQQNGAGKPTAAPGQPVTMSLPVPPPLPKVAPDKVVLTVGNVSLTAEQFDQLADSAPEQARAFYKGPGRKQFADQIAKILVLAQEGERRKLDQKPAFKIQSQIQIDAVLASAAVADVNQTVKVDDATLHKYYDAHLSEFQQAHARHILIRMKGSPVPVRPGQKDITDAEALDKAQDIVKRLKAGEDFAKVAAAESDDTGSANSGGDLGTFEHGRMVPSFDEAVFKMQAGQLSDPVKSQFGYHIIKVESLQAKSFEDAKPVIEKKLRDEEVKNALDEIEKNAKPVYDPEFFQLAKQ